MSGWSPGFSRLKPGLQPDISRRAQYTEGFGTAGLASASSILCFGVVMNLGKLIRLNRLFSHSSGRLCSVAVDHLLGYSHGMPPGLRQIAVTLSAVAAGRPDAVTMHKGIAASAWTPYAGAIPLIVQSTMARPDDTARQQAATPEDAVRWGPTPSPWRPSSAARRRPTISAWSPIASARQPASRSP